MRNLEGSEAGTRFTGRTAVAPSPLTAFAELTGAVKTELAGPVPVSVSDLPTVAVRLDPERTLPMEPVILAQLCAETQVSARRRILPMGLEYSVHVEFAAESLPQVVAAAPSVVPAAARQRASLLQLLALILGPLLGLSGGAGVAWQLSRPATRPPQPGVAALHLPSKPPAAPLSPRPLRPPPSSAQATTALAGSSPQSAPPVSATTVQPERWPAAASPAIRPQTSTQPSSPPGPVSVSASPASISQVSTQPSSPPGPVPVTASPASSPGSSQVSTQPSSPPGPVPVSASPASSASRSQVSTQPSSPPGPVPVTANPASSPGSSAPMGLPVNGTLRGLPATATEGLRPSDALAPSEGPLKRAAVEVAARRMPTPAVRAAAAARIGTWYRPLPSLANLASGLELDSPPLGPAPLLAPPATTPALLPGSEPPAAPASQTAALPLSRPASVALPLASPASAALLLASPASAALPLASPASAARRRPQQPESNQAPRYLSGEQPRLPRLVRQMYRRETVIGTYRLCVNPSGAVSAVTPLVGIPFDEEIQGTLRSWRFAPRPTAVCIDQELHFKVDE